MTESCGMHLKGPLFFCGVTLFSLRFRLLSSTSSSGSCRCHVRGQWRLIVCRITRTELFSTPMKQTHIQSASRDDRTAAHFDGNCHVFAAGARRHKQTNQRVQYLQARRGTAQLRRRPRSQHSSQPHLDRPRQRQSSRSAPLAIGRRPQRAIGPPRRSTPTWCGPVPPHCSGVFLHLFFSSTHLSAFRLPVSRARFSNCVQNVDRSWKNTNALRVDAFVLIYDLVGEKGTRCMNEEGSSLSCERYQQSAASYCMHVTASMH